MSIQDTIRERYSVRFYQKEPIAEETRTALLARLKALRSGPLGSSTRFELVAATDQERASLRGLGTYGFIKDASGFILGAVEVGEHALEDYGYMMERAILEATALGLGTCWLGGSFTQSSFARKMSKRDNEIIPAVAATGYAAPEGREKDLLRRGARADRRQPWERLFFDGSFGKPLARAELTGGYAQALEMVRIAPSASNKQPWRVVREDSRWHFYCQRTPGYGKGSWVFTLLRLADLQRLDVGIAMCHFELTADELGLEGAWRVADPGLRPIDERTLYIATWAVG
jgi:nitroreductase